jgi:hypothetical protein
MGMMRILERNFVVFHVRLVDDKRGEFEGYKMPW